jgi:hypothetical protein
MWRRIALLGLGLALAAGFWWRQHPAHPAPVKASLYETEMAEMLVKNILTGLKPPVPPVCFLAFGEGTTPPSPAFIARFAGSQPAVISCGSAASPPIGRYFETSTGRQGLVIHIVNFKQPAPGTFEVEVRFSNLPSGHDRLIYRVVRDDGGWVVKSSHPA